MEESSNPTPFKQFHSYGRQDSYLYNYLSANHRNSFEEHMERGTKQPKQQALDPSLGLMPPVRLFECSNNSE